MYRSINWSLWFSIYKDTFDINNYLMHVVNNYTCDVQGVLRTMDTLLKFKHSARSVPGSKPPLLCYCEALMQCAPAYRPLSKEEGLECVQCALDNGQCGDHRTL